jgi:hypothetical protein
MINGGYNEDLPTNYALQNAQIRDFFVVGFIYLEWRVYIMNCGAPCRQIKDV